MSIPSCHPGRPTGALWPGTVKTPRGHMRNECTFPPLPRYRQPASRNYRVAQSRWVPVGRHQSAWEAIFPASSKPSRPSNQISVAWEICVGRSTSPSYAVLRWHHALCYLGIGDLELRVPVGPPPHQSNDRDSRFPLVNGGILGVSRSWGTTSVDCKTG